MGLCMGEIFYLASSVTAGGASASKYRRLQQACERAKSIRSIRTRPVDTATGRATLGTANLRARREPSFGPRRGRFLLDLIDGGEALAGGAGRGAGGGRGV